MNVAKADCIRADRSLALSFAIDNQLILLSLNECARLHFMESIFGSGTTVTEVYTWAIIDPGPHPARPRINHEISPLRWRPHPKLRRIPVSVVVLHVLRVVRHLLQKRGV